MNNVKIITIDGPSGSGKGTISRILAEQLGFHYLDSGALYRLLGLVAVRHGIEISINADLTQLAKNMDVSFQAKADGHNIVLLEGEDVTDELRTEETGALASRVAENPRVRSALLERQHQFARLPGLVADGRDMGTKVFPEAQLKIFLTASIEERASRRYKQLLEKGENVKLRALEEQVRSRDERDMNRETSPLAAAADAVEVDSSDLTIQEAVDSVRNLAILRGLL
ncbi:(d)CMP kinase [Porticoccaceae bacterium]|jgi:cytidylate kinase|nr:(d)CMP kinase [Porticoccaceae bacterium]MDB3925839.1 (d)CMP kinase [Porticoccaceae bacterium]